MKKETVMAIVLGIVFGVGVALFLVLKTKKEEQLKVIPVTTSAQITPVVERTATIDQVLTISQPEENTITDKKSITIKGKAANGSLLVMQSPVKILAVSLENNDYSEDFPLALGENVIQLTVYPKDTKITPQSKTLTVYYLPEK